MQRDAVWEHQVGGDFKEWPQHKTAIFHVVVRYRQAGRVYYVITKQHDVEIECAAPSVRLCERDPVVTQYAACG